MSEALARVRWTLGQILLPEHFRTLEDVLARESYIHGSASGLPAHGLTRLEWNGTAPASGVVEVTSAQWVRDTGDVIDYPGNANLIQPLDLEAPKLPELDVYLHLLDELERDDPGPTEPAQPHQVARSPRTLALSVDARMEGSAGYVRLGRLEKPTGGTWRLRPEVVPPILRVGPTGYFVDAIRALRGELDAFENVLLGRLLDSESPQDARWAAQRCRIEARKLGGVIDDVLLGRVPLHPYLLFGACRSFALELDVLEGATSLATVPHYDHDDLGTTVGGTIAAIRGRLQGQPAVTPVMRFDREQLAGGDAWLILRNIPAHVFRADELFFLVHKPSPDLEVSLRAAPMGAPSRLREVVRRELKPVQLYRQLESHVTRVFGPWVDAYYVDRQASGVEWQYVERERALAIVVRGLDARVHAHLYWVSGTSGASTRPGT